MCCAPRPPHVGFAFRRLKICDLSEAANQPMGSADQQDLGRLQRRDLQFPRTSAELEALGQVFRTHGDTEVVLAAYEQWGERCFDRLDGMWGIRDSRSAPQSPGGVARPLRHQAGLLEDRSGRGDAVRLRNQADPCGNRRRVAARKPAADRGFLARLSISDAGGNLLRGHPLGPAGDLVRDRSCGARGAALPILLETCRLHRRGQQAVLRRGRRQGRGAADGRSPFAPPGRREGRRVALGRPRLIDAGRARASQWRCETADLFDRLPRCRAGLLRDAFRRCHDAARRDREPRDDVRRGLDRRQYRPHSLDAGGAAAGDAGVRAIPDVRILRRARRHRDPGRAGGRRNQRRLWLSPARFHQGAAASPAIARGVVGIAGDRASRAALGRSPCSSISSFATTQGGDRSFRG